MSVHIPFRDDYVNEKDFEEDLIEKLQKIGKWSKEVLFNVDQNDLLENWKRIIERNNKGVLNNLPLVKGEMEQIYDNFKNASPYQVNELLISGEVTIKRENRDDVIKVGTDITLKIFDRHNFEAGKIEYQIAHQVVLQGTKGQKNSKIADIVLLIDGIPLFQIELKKNNVSLDEAEKQYARYIKAGVYSGIFSLIQILVMMNPSKSRYFANPGNGADPNIWSKFIFEWKNKSGEPMNRWNDFVESFLIIPTAHEIVSNFTIADTSLKKLIVMRSYQYHATKEIIRKITNNPLAFRHDKNNITQNGGYIWHTTGSGKTMTSFKVCQILSQQILKNSGSIIFMVLDRSDLGKQTKDNFQYFINETSKDSVIFTESTAELKHQVFTRKTNSCRIVITSIQKLTKFLKAYDGLNASDFQNRIYNKKFVFIFDEAHRSTNGDSFKLIRTLFSSSPFFGFTGTPLLSKEDFDNNGDNMFIEGKTTEEIFGQPLHKYLISDGIKDGNVLGFDPYIFTTVNYESWMKSYLSNELEKYDGQPKKQEEIKKKLNFLPNGICETTSKQSDLSIEKLLEKSGYYETTQHRIDMIKNIQSTIEKEQLKEKKEKVFHGILATTSIKNACEIYDLFKIHAPNLRVTALFDASDYENDSNHDYDYIKNKDEKIKEIMNDYNEMYNLAFTDNKDFHNDVRKRLAHSGNYNFSAFEKTLLEKNRIDLVIVVDQLLTGFDSKWVSYLFLDKFVKMHLLIQAFSRTNRVFDETKKFGIIKYYRKPYSQDLEFKHALNRYAISSKSSISNVKAKTLKQNIDDINKVFDEIKKLYEEEGYGNNFSESLKDRINRRKYIKLVNMLHSLSLSATMQGFVFGDDVETNTFFTHINNENKEEEIFCNLTKTDYNAIVQRYKTLEREERKKQQLEKNGEIEEIFDFEREIYEYDLEKIDAKYFREKYATKLSRFFDENHFNNNSELNDRNPDGTFKHNAKRQEWLEIVTDYIKGTEKYWASLSDEDRKIYEDILSEITKGELLFTEDIEMLKSEYLNTKINKNVNLVLQEAKITLAKEIAELFSEREKYYTKEDDKEYFDTDFISIFSKIRDEIKNNLKHNVLYTNMYDEEEFKNFKGDIRRILLAKIEQKIRDFIWDGDVNKFLSKIKPE
ncbi:HsdR family type I site-specific deoxyribonuclease [[Mycoplasma] gypis]|uniref:Type I restriction enzyme endonuclease subunit n=1 Tax=[Mycoplasma] gypis TaxID=92404 RepID=A0ABZ2RPQ3_9BACT|nr:HsdR family type I site-specific deoxyribonuclease [[Mycoplasma] gypis]MBN0919223.1 type I restriction endonuclease subunit R [[Mycoplasma] gypis]